MTTKNCQQVTVAKMILTSLKPGDTAYIVGLSAEASLEQRLLALGFRPGRQILVLRKAWFNGPVHVRVGTTEVFVRRCDATAIQLTMNLEEPA